MDNLLYFDLLITNQNFTLNSGNEPELCHNRRSITQDVAHRIIESGLATQLVAERSPTLRADIRTQMEILVESDERLIPGTIVIDEESTKRLWITADTYDFGRISLGMNYE
ncbi:DUF2590 family protein [Providencia alcalifaciens]|uniref:PF10761 family protein n=1 Tax=Providencia alcalifaciens 205/92 TaxID=1256988 RepID=A0AAV3M1L1_9GAMM|nr:DUF2590 family protein [Providencia alcalifaciens]EUD09688.1 PF10761 family protein [Providencia alcalifaciens 205/92]